MILNEKGTLLLEVLEGEVNYLKNQIKQLESLQSPHDDTKTRLRINLRLEGYKALLENTEVELKNLQRLRAIEIKTHDENLTALDCKKLLIELLGILDEDQEALLWQ